MDKKQDVAIDACVPSGIEWHVSLRAECRRCGTKEFDDAAAVTVFKPSYNSQPDYEELFDLRAAFTEKLMLEGWEIYGLDHYDAAGEFQCSACVRKENESEY